MIIIKIDLESFEVKLIILNCLKKKSGFFLYFYGHHRWYALVERQNGEQVQTKRWDFDKTLWL